MINYDLASLVVDQPAKGARIILAPIEERRTAVQAYIVALRRMLRGLAAEMRTGIIPAYRADRLTRDVDQNTFQNMKALSAQLGRTTSATVERILNLEAIRHTETFMTEARRALGVDLTAVVKSEDLDEYLRRAVARNTSLITSLSDDMVKRVEQAILQNEIAGRSVKTLKKELAGQLGIVDRRAQLIARDQTAKLNSDMNKIRQQQAGIESYEWSTSGDERVRQLHQGLQGKEYKWNEPTGAEGGLPPGQPIQCRCVARAIVFFGKKRADPVTTTPIRAEPVTTRRRPARNEPSVLPTLLPAERGTPGLPIPRPTAAVQRATAIAKLESEAKSFVVTEGLRDGNEHLTAYDRTMLLPVEKSTSGKKGFVGISPKLLAAIRVETNDIVIHHNHPSSSSFSHQDLDLLSRYRGAKGIWAHGHNGSSYYAERGVRHYTANDWKSIDKRLRPMMQKAVNERELDVSHANVLWAHLIAEVMHKKEMIRYSATLTDLTAEAVAKNKDLIADLLGRFTK